jgi:hypothetical protein
VIFASDNQQRWRFYLVECIFGQIWRSAAGHYRCDLMFQSGSGDKRSRGPRACPEKANREILQIRLAHCPSGCRRRTLGEQWNVKTKLHCLLVNLMLLFG